MIGVRAVITGEHTLRFERFDVPEQPAADQVLVQAERTIISAGTELANYTGLEPDTRTPGRWCCYPWNPGYGGIGRVLAVGSGVAGVVAGQRVYGILRHATHHTIDTSRELCVAVPDGLDSTTAAFVRMGNVAINGYQRARVDPGDTVAIIGVGLVGNLAGQFYARAGCRVFGLDVSSVRRSLAEATGFTGSVDARAGSLEELCRRVLEATGGVRPRVVVDAVGESRLVEQAVSLAECNGQVILLGTPRAAYETDLTPMLKLAHVRGIAIQGALEWTIPLLKRLAVPGATTVESNAEMMLEMLRDESLRVGPLCSQVLPPSELDRAYRGLLNEKDRYLGVVLDWENHPAPQVD